MFVQTFVPELAVEGLDVGVLGRPAGLDQLEVDAVAVGPLVKCPAGEFRPLVGADRCR